MTSKPSPNSALSRQALMAGDRARLAELTLETGKKLLDEDRLRAALAFGALYVEATERRRDSRTIFQDRLRQELRARGLERIDPQVRKLKLPRAIKAIDREIVHRYRGKPEPHRSLRHYLAAVCVAADLLGQDRAEAQIAFLRNLSIWQTTPRLEVAEEAWDAANSLWRMLDAMCRAVAQQTKLLTAIRRTEYTQMKWDPFLRQLHASDGYCMDGPVSPVHPVCDFGTHISEQRPFPSVQLLRVPMGWANTELFVEQGPGTGAEILGGERRSGVLEPRAGRLIQYREVRLALAPIDERQCGGVLLSQDAVIWRDAGPAGGTEHRLVGEGNWTDMAAVDERGFHPQFSDQYSRVFEIRLDDGWHRVARRRFDDLDQARNDYAEGCDWEWDPLEHPGDVPYLGRGYVSATRLTPDYVHHWLIAPQNMDQERAVCPWARDFPKPGTPLRAPLHTPARAIERALHDGSLEALLRERSEAIAVASAEILEASRRRSNAAEAAMMARWTNDVEKGGM